MWCEMVWCGGWFMVGCGVWCDLEANLWLVVESDVKTDILVDYWANHYSNIRGCEELYIVVTRHEQPDHFNQTRYLLGYMSCDWRLVLQWFHLYVIQVFIGNYFFLNLSRKFACFYQKSWRLLLNGCLFFKIKIHGL